MTQKQLISLCMIVRDGERSLARALASAQQFMDELVVVDTGSKDSTRYIARQAGARVFDFAWCDNFSAARNFALKQAIGDFVFYMDADDVLPESSMHEMRRAVAEQSGNNVAFWMAIEDENADQDSKRTRFAQLRLFPRHPQIRFCYRVHEQIAPSIRALGMALKPLNAVVRHSADRSRAAEQARCERNLRLALLDLNELPNDPFVWLSVGSTYLYMPDHLPDAITFLRRSIAGLPPSTSTQLNAYYYLGDALWKNGEDGEAAILYRQALKLFPNDSILLLRLGATLTRLNRFEEAVKVYQRIIEFGQICPQAIHRTDIQTQALWRLNDLYARTGSFKRAKDVSP